MRSGLSSKDWSKEGIQQFCLSFVTRAPTLLSTRPTFSLVFFLLLIYLKKPFLLSFASLARFNFIWALALSHHCILWPCPCILPKWPFPNIAFSPICRLHRFTWNTFLTKPCLSLSHGVWATTWQVFLSGSSKVSFNILSFYNRDLIPLRCIEFLLENYWLNWDRDGDFFYHSN